MLSYLDNALRAALHTLKATNLCRQQRKHFVYAGLLRPGEAAGTA